MKHLPLALAFVGAVIVITMSILVSAYLILTFVDLQYQGW